MVHHYTLIYSHIGIILNSIYSERKSDSVPEVYERVVDNPVEVLVNDTLLEQIKNSNGTFRISQVSLSNLLNFSEIRLLRNVD
jgi:hypothetical protein